MCEPTVFGGQEDIVKHRQGGAGGNGFADNVEATVQLGLAANDLHGRLPLVTWFGPFQRWLPHYNLSQSGDTSTLARWFSLAREGNTGSRTEPEKDWAARFCPNQL